jgi:hypothetical protein
MVWRQLIHRVSDLSNPLRPLRSELAKAKPVDENWRFKKHFDIEAEYPHLRTQHQYQDQRVDGLWVCHCDHENELKHYTGPYPFKKMVLGQLCVRPDLRSQMHPGPHVCLSLTRIVPTVRAARSIHAHQLNSMLTQRQALSTRLICLRMHGLVHDLLKCNELIIQELRP